ncbi:MAG: hypothetical protein GY830_04870 [Bacteroidetes bacterium]|nr:hypothetical protein [Bacteroidota bacterium]
MKKAISFGVMIMTLGVTLIKNIGKKIKSTYDSAKAFGNQAYNNGKEVASGIFKAVGTSFGTQIVNGGIHFLLDNTIEEDISKELRKTIKRKVASQVIEKIRSNKTFKDAVEIDKNTGKPYWQTKFNGYANEIFNKKENELLQICKTVSNIVAKREVTNAIDNIGAKILTRVTYTTFETLNEIKKLNKFLKNFNDDIQRKIDNDKKDIDKQKKQIKVNNQKKSESNKIVYASSSSYVDDEKYNGDDNIFDLSSGKDFSNINNRSIKKLDADVDPVTFNFLDSLEDHLVSCVSGQVKGNIIKNISETSMETISNILPEVITQMHKKGQIRKIEKAKATINKVPAKISEIDKIYKDFKSDKIAFIDDDLKRRADDIYNDSYKGSFDIVLNSEAQSVNINVFDDNNKLIYSSGSKYGKSIKLRFSDADGKGHYRPFDKNITFKPSGNHSCLTDSVAVTINKSVDDIKKQKLAYLSMNQDKCKVISGCYDKIGKVDSDYLFLGGAKKKELLVKQKSKKFTGDPLNVHLYDSKYVDIDMNENIFSHLETLNDSHNNSMPSFYDPSKLNSLKGLQFYDSKYAPLYFANNDKIENSPFGLYDHNYSDSNSNRANKYECLKHLTEEKENDSYNPQAKILKKYNIDADTFEHISEETAQYLYLGDRSLTYDLVYGIKYIDDKLKEFANKYPTIAKSTKWAIIFQPIIKESIKGGIAGKPYGPRGIALGAIIGGVKGLPKFFRNLIIAEIINLPYVQNKKKWANEKAAEVLNSYNGNIKIEDAKQSGGVVFNLVEGILAELALNGLIKKFPFKLKLIPKKFSLFAKDKFGKWYSQNLKH